MLATVSASALNVRSIPNITGKILGVLPSGTIVDALPGNDDWVEIPFNHTSGFVYKSYLTPQTQSFSLSGFIDTGLLNVRNQPSLAGQILGTLLRGARIVVTARIQDWLEIEFNHSLGYVAAQYVSLFSPGESYPAIVTSAALNVRAAPQIKATVLGQLMQGNRLVVESDIGDWSAIRFNGNPAYVLKNHLKPVTEDEEQTRIPVSDDDEAPILNRSLDAKSPLDHLQPLQQIRVAGNLEQKNVAATWNRYGALLTTLSQEKGIDVACAIAVLCVESRGKGFEQNNADRMILRFENHKFWSFWGKHNPERFRLHFQYDKDKVWTGHRWRASADAPWQPFHGNQAKEWQVFEFAKHIDAAGAMQSISMGAPQIMGFHYQRIGYQSVNEMFSQFSSEMTAQITGLFDFFSETMLTKLKNLEFVDFAAHYNGSGQKSLYGRRIQSHYLAFKKMQPTFQQL